MSMRPLCSTSGFLARSSSVNNARMWIPRSSDPPWKRRNQRHLSADRKETRNPQCTTLEQPAASPHPVVALAVSDSMAVLLVKVKAVLHQELHRLWLYDVLLRTQQGEIIHLHQVCVRILGREVKEKRSY